MKYLLYFLILFGAYLFVGGILEYNNPTSLFIFGLQGFDYGNIAFPILGASISILSGTILAKKYYWKTK